MPLPDAPEQPASLRFFISSPTGRWLNRQGSLQRREAKNADLPPGAEPHLYGWVQPTPAAVIGDVGDDHGPQEMRADVASRPGVVPSVER